VRCLRRPEDKAQIITVLRSERRKKRGGDQLFFLLGLLRRIVWKLRPLIHEGFHEEHEDETDVVSFFMVINLSEIKTASVY